MEDFIKYRKELANLLSKAKNRAKPETCIICGKPQTSFCNSHSIPQMVLKAIADNGKLLSANALIGIEVLDLEKGVNNAGTFHFICNKCDGKLFQHYENIKALKEYPEDIMLSEIALKNILMMLSKRNVEKALFDIFQRKRKQLINKELLDSIKEMDIEEYIDEINLYRDIIDNEKVGCFHLLYWKVLPYTVPIAVQTPICIYKDMNQNIVNDVYSENPNCRMQYLHLCVFPIEKETVVVLFHHIRDKNYRKIRHWLNSVSEKTKLMYINYLIFAYTENYFISNTVKEKLEASDELKKLSQEYNGIPNLGLVKAEEYLRNYQPIVMENIPNFLSEESALRR